MTGVVRFTSVYRNFMLTFLKLTSFLSSVQALSLNHTEVNNSRVKISKLNRNKLSTACSLVFVIIETDVQNKCEEFWIPFLEFCGLNFYRYYSQSMVTDSYVK